MTPNEKRAAIAQDWCDRMVATSILGAATTEGERTPRTNDMPAAQLVLVRTDLPEPQPLGSSVWNFTWRIWLYVPLDDYAVAFDQLAGVVISLVYESNRLRAQHVSLNQADDWRVIDEGDEPDPRNEDGVMVKRLLLIAEATTTP